MDEIRYSDDHVWVQLEQDNIAAIGITNYAQEELGDIVYIELPAPGSEVDAQQDIAVIESVKTAADVVIPVSGTIIEVNELLSEIPELMNESPEEDGWICRIRLSDVSDFDNLMDSEEYQFVL